MKASPFYKVLGVIAAALLQGACLMGPDDSHSNPGPNVAQGSHRNEVAVDRDPLRLTLETDRTGYEQGQPVDITFTVSNPSHHAMTLSFVNGQEHDIEILDSHDNVVANSSFGRMYTMALHDRTIAPGHEVTYRWTWDQTGNNDEPLSPGHYQVRARLTESEGRRSGTLDFEIVHTP
ncbi:MAG: hypothetical protein DHS20C21_24680 [Gemmatimonadota bacterium]|nr:MAG: hypothetical protein DHS20C21_24680 [Gemmatimonadota bacterium]